MKTIAKTISSKMVKSITVSIRSTLKQEGLQKAREQWAVLNNTCSTEDWWPPVARAVRQLLDDYADEEKQKQTEKSLDRNNIYINNTNSQTEQHQWNPNINRVNQLIGVAEKGADVSYTKEIAL